MSEFQCLLVFERVAVCWGPQKASTTGRTSAGQSSSSHSKMLGSPFSLSSATLLLEDADMGSVLTDSVRRRKGRSSLLLPLLAGATFRKPPSLLLLLRRKRQPPRFVSERSEHSSLASTRAAAADGAAEVVAIARGIPNESRRKKQSSGKVSE